MIFCEDLQMLPNLQCGRQVLAPSCQDQAYLGNITKARYYETEDWISSPELWIVQENSRHVALSNPPQYVKDQFWNLEYI